MVQLSNDNSYAMLEMDLERIKELLKKFVEYYEENMIIIPAGPSRIGIAVHPDTEKMFCDKFHLTEENFNKLIGDISFFIGSLVRNNEERIFKKYGKKKKIKKIVEIFKKILQDRIIEALRFKYFCKTQYLENLSWDVSLKVKQSGGTQIRFPFSMIKMSFSKPGFSLESILGEESTVTFECTLRDIDEMIKTLEDIKIALHELQPKGEENE